MLVLGIDIGGTSIKGAAVDEKGHIYDKFNVPVESGEAQEVTVNKMVDAIKTYLKTNHFDEPISAIGLGIPGSIDAKNGIVTYSNNLHWNDLNIVKILNEHFAVPIKITNDANAAALGEAKFGAGRIYSNVVMLTLGTGLGSGVIIDGKIYEGSDGTGAELGHVVICKDGVKCTCGRRGCLEQYASATALVRQTKEALELHPESAMHKIVEQDGKVSAKTPFIAAKMNDRAALDVVNHYIEYLGTGICNICNIFRPDCIVLSGGVSKEGEYLTSRLEDYCKFYHYGFFHSKEAIIKVAELGYDAGIIGAATLVL